MTNEQSILLALLRTEIFDGFSLNVDVDLDKANWDDVLKSAQEHAVAGVVFDGIQRIHSIGVLPSSFNTEQKLNCYAWQKKVEQQNEKVNAVVEELFSLMTENAIPAVLLKGQGVARHYRKPLHRMSGDIDLYVGEKNYEKAKTVLKERKWIVGNDHHEDIKHLGFSYHGVSIELHRRCAFIPGKRSNEYLHQKMEQALVETKCGYKQGESFVRVLPDAENLVFTFIHLFKHFISGGVGLRQLMDLAVLTAPYCVREKSRRKDCGELEELLKETGFVKAWQVFGCVMVKYLGFDSLNYPFYNQKYERLADDVMGIIMKDGNFGSARISKHNRKRGALAEYWQKIKGLLRLYRLFPKDCLRFLFRQIENTGEKYFKR